MSAVSKKKRKEVADAISAAASLARNQGQNAVTAIPITYMIHDADGDLAGGPYLGAPGLDFSALAAQFRTERYEQAEAAREDWCPLASHQLIDWLLENGILSVLDTVRASVDMDTSASNHYIPKHWPICPECDQGRGKEDMGRVLHALNRADWHRVCTSCGHTWDHHDEPYVSDKPMIEDDGRLIQNGCVPYSISQVAALPVDQVTEVCRRWGWSEEGGMPYLNGVEAARQLGVNLAPGRIDAAGKVTLRRLLATLSPVKNYIVATKWHWLAVVRGENRDTADTGMRTLVEDFWEVRPAATCRSPKRK